MKLLTILISVLTPVCADIYLHNPKGSNNRLDENGRDRTNANRLFDSQNNNRGGYNVGSVYYHVGSKLQIEWTHQHSCNAEYSNCDIIIQYMCGDLVRDGASTKAPDFNPRDCYRQDCDTDLENGLHEDHAYYIHCRLRESNSGLFLADQKPTKKTAAFTRQNPKGTRRGYECPEERDYYPYWHPSPWKDIAVLTDNVTRCPHYQEESQNVKSRWYCHLPREFLLDYYNDPKIIIPSNQWDCEAFRYPPSSAESVKGEWKEVPAHGIDPPDCMEAPITRDNHHGNTLGGYTPNYNWTVPSDVHENCVMRIRYNISTGDYKAWDGVDSSNNQVKKNTGADVGLHEKFGFESKAAADQRGFTFKNNPQVELFGELDGFKLALAINTAQYGRTFQDRSHTFAIRPRPDNIGSDIIQNVNVRGKRGNIVQVYPGVEYDFVPNTLELAKNQYIHFQWTGSNSNPQANDGEGARGTDRSNVIMQDVQAYEEGSGVAYEFDSKYGHWGRSYPQMLTNESLVGFSVGEMEQLALLTNHKNFRGSLAQLNDVGPYFDNGPKRATETGIYHYMSTRNNNFSNRSQKGRLICRAYVVEQKSIGWNGGTFALSNQEAKLTVERGAFTSAKNMRMEQWSASQGKAKVKAQKRKLPAVGDVAAAFLVVHPEEPLTEEGQTITVEMKIDYKGIDSVQVYRSESTSFTTWSKVNADVSGGKASFQTSEGGVYVALVDSNVGVIIGAVIGSLLFVGLVVAGTVWYCRKHPGHLSAMRRSMKPRI